MPRSTETQMSIGQRLAEGVRLRGDINGFAIVMVALAMIFTITGWTEASHQIAEAQAAEQARLAAAAATETPPAASFSAYANYHCDRPQSMTGVSS
ncbi:MAG: hypothetical protein AAFR55_07225 [Pseudomonadota bacterium]